MTSFVHPKCADSTAPWPHSAAPVSRHNKANNNRTIAETLAYFDTVAARATAEGITLRAAIACSFISPWADERIELATVLEMVQRFAAGGCTMITLADTIGKAEPGVVAATIAAVQGRTRIPFSLHFHDLRGSAFANVDAALD